MQMITITGKQALHGRIRPAAAKNSTLPLLAATLLCRGPCRLQEVPALADVTTSLALLQAVGADVRRCGADLCTRPVQTLCGEIPESLAGAMRSSVFYLAPLLCRTGYVRLPLPGGCRLGPRPVDIHLAGLAAMGAEVELEGIAVTLRRKGPLHGVDFTLRLPSVGATLTLLLMAACCARGRTVLRGAAQEREVVLREGLNSAAVQYAMSRQGLYDEGKHIEILAAYEPAFRFFAEWWKQLFGESEGKSGKGVFPASVDLTPDLHSMGQYMQQGLRMLQETVVFFDQARARVEIPTDADNLDGLNYLAGKTMDYVNEVAMKATKKAHIDGGVPVTEIRVERICEETVGALIYFFEFACGVSGYISGVNPFNQPGVEAYKTNMFEMLGKPGYEKK